MYRRFRERGYSHLPLKAINGALNRKREDLLITQKTNQEKAQNPEESFPRIITRFGFQWTEVQNILNRHWHILRSAPTIANTVSLRPLIAKRACNLSNALVHYEYKQSEILN